MPRPAKEPNICLIKTEHVCTFVNMLQQIEPNIYPYIEQAGLPANVLTTKHPYMPEVPVRNLLEIVAQKAGEDKFQQLMWESTRNIFIPSVLFNIKKATTVFEALQEFIEVRKIDSPHSQVVLQEALGKTWLGRHKAPIAANWFELSEQFAVTYMIELIRALTKQADWLPEQISIQSEQQNTFKNLLNCDGKGTSTPHLFTERNFSAVSIEPKLLALPYHPKLQWQQDQLNVMQMPNFYESLITVLPPYLLAGKLPIEQASKITGMSVRTLQRNLQALGQSYRQVLEELQSKQAQKLLAGHEYSITTISEHLGYSNIAHFSRAFKKAVGLTPSQYRNQFK